MPGASDAFLGPLLRTIAQSLDVREIFGRISAEARRTVPHDFLYLGLLTGDHQRMTLVALSGEFPDGLTEVGISDSWRATYAHDAIVLNDMTPPNAASPVITGLLRTSGDEAARRVEFDVQPLYRELAIVRGFRSFMRVSVRLRGGVLGGLVFCSKAPDAYSDDEVEKAREIADCVALAVAHQHLAEEQQRTIEARERAARLEARVQRLTEELEDRTRRRTIGRSKRWRDVLSQATKVAPTEATVLLTGESGTGKEVVARFIHHGSPRGGGPFVALNCAALPEALLESELFGHEKGAFTGALTARPGKIEQAGGGVLFLDEVGDMSPAVQAKFLRVLQEREYQRLGGARTLRADVRVLAATNRNLKAATAQGAFREDLYYRLAVFEISLPPLREREEDILPLVEAFLEDIGHSIGRPAAGMSEEVQHTLKAYPWPGNVRELRNAIERAVILCEGGLITSDHLPIGIVSPTDAVRLAHATGAVPAPAGSLESVERDMIVQALTRSGDNKSKAARLLGLTRAQLRSRLEKHGIATKP
jgi:transcriptional regulator with GAF, ATPase, and Fis domain